MRRRILTLIALAMMAATLLTPSFASARGNTNPQPPPFKQPLNVILDETSRNATTVYHGKRGCVETGVHLFVAELKQAWSDGSTLHYPRVGLFAHQENVCNDTTIFMVEFYSETMNFTVSDQFSGASATGQAIANNIYGDEELLVTLNVTWTPAGSLRAEESSEVINVLDPATGQHVDAFQKATDYFRLALARGAVTIGDQTFNFNNRDAETRFYGFDNTWTEVIATP